MNEPVGVALETFNIHEAKTYLSKLVERAAKGGSFIIAKAGKPLVKLVPLDGSVAIKFALGRPEFALDPRVLRRGLLDNGFSKLAVAAQHALATVPLPAIHKDPFDRLRVAQATAKGITLLTADAPIPRYPGPIQRV